MRLRRHLDPRTYRVQLEPCVEQGERFVDGQRPPPSTLGPKNRDTAHRSWGLAVVGSERSYGQMHQVSEVVFLVLQARRLILLEDPDDPIVQRQKKVLESPLGLAQELVAMSFHRGPPAGLALAERDLDSIKKFAAGLSTAEGHAPAYRVAGYSVYAFSLQQFFASSYRARQGNVLERALDATLSDGGLRVWPKSDHKKVLKSELGFVTASAHDVDVLARNKADEFLLIQVRSRDDTGGTTAKGSLVELLADLLRSKAAVKKPILYLIFVWESLEGSQKASLVSKALANLSGMIATSEMSKPLLRGEAVTITPEIKLQLAYGTTQASNVIGGFASNPKVNELLAKVLEMTWDDLWMAYGIASLELERLVLDGKSNFDLLDEKLRATGITIQERDLRDYMNSSERIAQQVLGSWKEDTLPVKAPADALTYVRDLVLLKMIHVKMGSMARRLLKRRFGV